MDAVKDPTTGRLYKQEISLCGKERCKKCERGDGHGPYWYAYWWEGGKTRKKYIGKTLPASLTQDNLQKTEVLTQDSEESYVRPLPKTDTLHKTTGLTQDKSLPKTAGKGALPKTDEGVVERALEVIRDFHSRGVEPSVSQVAEVVGGHPKHLGRWLKALSERLDEARAIIAEAKLSGLPDALEGDPYRQAVTWEDTAALRGSG